jgi:endonuclease III
MPPTLDSALDALRNRYGEASLPPARGPWQWVLWENVVYLADDARRAAAFEVLRQNTGFEPDAILDADDDALLIATSTGILAKQQAGKLRECAQIALDDFHGNVDVVLDWPPIKAQRALRQFPGIGTPGAEKILMFEGAFNQLALESNGLRVLLRLGFGEEQKAYAATYKSVREALGNQAPAQNAELAQAHLLLRQLGQEVCTRAKPNCASCPLLRQCPSSSA